MTGEGELSAVPTDWVVVQTWTYALDQGRRSAHRLRRA